jgi:hypothetical protein
MLRLGSCMLAFSQLCICMHVLRVVPDMRCLPTAFYRKGCICLVGMAPMTAVPHRTLLGCCLFSVTPLPGGPTQLWLCNGWEYYASKKEQIAPTHLQRFERFPGALACRTVLRAMVCLGGGWADIDRAWSESRTTLLAWELRLVGSLLLGHMHENVHACPVCNALLLPAMA